MSYAQYNALSAEAKQSLDTSLSLTGPDSSDVRAVKYTGIGLVRSTLDSNGNVVNTKLNNAFDDIIMWKNEEIIYEET